MTYHFSGVRFKHVEPKFADDKLEQLESDASADFGYSPAVVKAYRKRMQQIRAAQDERDLHSTRSLHFEKLKGTRSYQHSMRLNDQWRLIVELAEGKSPNKPIHIIGIEDYH